MAVGVGGNVFIARSYSPYFRLVFWHGNGFEEA